MITRGKSKEWQFILFTEQTLIFVVYIHCNSHINVNTVTDYVSFVKVMNQCDVFLSHLITLTIKKNYNQINQLSPIFPVKHPNMSNILKNLLILL